MVKLGIGWVMTLLVTLILVSGVTSTIQAKSGSSTKWTTYSDPYGRYTINYPSNWIVQTTPVKSSYNEFDTVPFSVADIHNGLTRVTLIVQELDNNQGSNVREVASLFQNNIATLVGSSKVLSFDCGYYHPEMESCRYLTTSGFGLFQTGSIDEIFVDQQKRAFVVTYIANTPSQIKSKNIENILNSFKLLSGSGNSNSYNDFLNSYYGADGSSSVNSKIQDNFISSCTIGNIEYGICPSQPDLIK